MKCCLCKKTIDEKDAVSPVVLLGRKCCKECHEKITKALDEFLEGYQDCEYAILLKNGSAQLIKPKGRHFSLKELQTAVGGYVEIVRSQFCEYYYVVNEEARIRNYPLNEICDYFFEDEFYGDVLLTPIKFIK